MMLGAFFNLFAAGVWADTVIQGKKYIKPVSKNCFIIKQLGKQ
jgi:hypothetical protein